MVMILVYYFWTPIHDDLELTTLVTFGGFDHFRDIRISVFPIRLNDIKTKMTPFLMHSSWIQRVLVQFMTPFWVHNSTEIWSFSRSRTFKRLNRMDHFGVLKTSVFVLYLLQFITDI